VLAQGGPKAQAKRLPDSDYQGCLALAGQAGAEVPKECYFSANSKVVGYRVLNALSHA
jgi:hypothetical protein